MQETAYLKPAGSNLAQYMWRLGGFVISAVDSGSSSLGSSHSVVFLGKTLYSHVASLHPEEQMGIGEFNGKGNPVMD